MSGEPPTCQPLPEGVLAELDIGWGDTARYHASSDDAGAYVFPEHDGQSRLIGASYRFPADKVGTLTDADGKRARKAQRLNSA